MNIKLVGISELDGAAFCKIKDQIYFLDPSYKDLLKINEDGFRRAMVHYNYSSMQKDFSNWKSLINYLNTAVKKARKEKGLNISDEDLNKDIIDLAPVEVLERYLTRIEKELFPNKKFNNTEKILSTMLMSKNVKSYDHIFKKVVILFKESLRLKGVRI